MIPRRLYWRDGRVFDLNVITEDSRPAMKSAGNGTRYTVRVTYKGMNLPGNVTYLYFEPEHWFVEDELPYTARDSVEATPC